MEDGTQLETPGPTYSIYIMYNTSLSVSVSAHNCAGYSDPFSLNIKYNCFGPTRLSPYYCSTELVGLPSKTVTTNSIFTNTHNLSTTNETFTDFVKHSQFRSPTKSPTNKLTPARELSVGQLVLMVVPVTTVSAILTIFLCVFAIVYTFKRLAKPPNNATGTVAKCTCYVILDKILLQMFFLNLRDNVMRLFMIFLVGVMNIVIVGMTVPRNQAATWRRTLFT